VKEIEDAFGDECVTYEKEIDDASTLDNKMDPVSNLW
jgi:hypothetical protein